MLKRNKEKPSAEATKLLVQSGSRNEAESQAALQDMAEALTTPLRQGVLNGDILFNIFEPITLTGENGTSTSEFPLDFLSPGTEKEFVSFTIPKHGYIPQKAIEGDFVMVPTYPVGNAIDWNIRYARDARWDIVTKALEVMRKGFVKKDNDDGWHTLIAAGVDRNIVVYDSDGPGGVFTKRLISLTKTVMRRNGGGNSTSINRGKLTDVFLSPEAIEDIRNWNVDQVDEVTRREIFLAGDDVMTRIFGVNLHDLDELGEDQEYQDYYEDVLSGTLPGSTNEIMVGLDLSTNDSFVNPIRQELEIYPDPALLRQQRAGFFSWKEHGFAALDNRRVILMAM